MIDDNERLVAVGRGWLGLVVATHRQLPDKLTADGRGVGPPQDGAIAKTFLAGRPAFAARWAGAVAPEPASAAVVAGPGLLRVCSTYRYAVEPGHRDLGCRCSVFIPGWRGLIGWCLACRSRAGVVSSTSLSGSSELEPVRARPRSLDGTKLESGIFSATRQATATAKPNP